jgi:beta-N-acetylhexosaminidase
MNLGERVGQLFLLGLAGDDLAPEEAAAIKAQHFGSVWFTRTTHAGVDGVRAVTRSVQALAPEATRRVGFFFAANQEGGLIQALQGPGFSTIPSAEGQGTLDPATLQQDADRWGREMALAGVNMNFAPVADVVPPGADQVNQPIGVLHRGYGHDPQTVGSAVVAFIQGMQGAGIATTAKHFPGLGRVVGNTDNTSGVVDDVTGPDDPYLEPFSQAIQAGAPFVMVALATYTRIDPDHLAAFSPAVMDLLRHDLGFKGVIVSDDLGATKAVEGIDPGLRATAFLEAGGDLMIVRGLGVAIQMQRAVVSKATSDPGLRSLVDAAALRILEAKQAHGLLSCG